MIEDETKIDSTADAKEAKPEAVDDAQAQKPKGKKEKEVKAPQYIRSAKGKKRALKTIPKGRAYIHSSLNNTIITITDPNGNVVTWASAGNCGFRGPKKSTPYAASIIATKVAEKLEPFGMKELHVFTTGIGSGRDSAIRTLNTKGFNISAIQDTTPIPHNGCRSRRPRRV
ncbi:30S ribosomal protein S11 [Patescibacteria group bacterium]|nr:30S ribosomal protein S11 [Patescibacteria group bacterium]